MLLEYIDAAMRYAKYEILQEDGSFYGEISECNGVYANADNLEDCRKELMEVLEDWILLRIYKNLSLPIIDGLELSVKEVA
jgi:predicted RNase H-like HicB family nuclease